MTENFASGLHIVFGGGVARAITAGAGVIVACRRASLVLRTMGGVSAGAIVPLLAAAGMSDDQLIKAVIELPFQAFLHAHFPWTHYPRLLWRVLNRRHYLQSLPEHGLYDTKVMGDFLQTLVGRRWPPQYWTMAGDPAAQFIFTADGVTLRRQHDDRLRKLDNRSVPVSQALRATCALPGFFDAVEYTAPNKSYTLFDGFITWDGICPVGLVESFFKVPRQSIIACDVGKYGRPNRLLDKGYRAVITPDPPFPPYRLKLTRDEKVQGVLSGFGAAVSALRAAGLCDQIEPLVLQ